MKRQIAFLIVFFILISLFPATVNAESSLSERLLAEYRFDNETTNDSAGSHDAVFYNDKTVTAASFANGVSGKALQLSAKGTDQKYWLSVPYSVFENHEDSFTVSLWYKSTGYNTSGEDSELFSFYNSGAEKFMFYAPVSQSFQNMGYTFKWDGAYGYANVISPYAPNEWVHLVYCVQASGTQSKISAYVNGKTVYVDQGGGWDNSLMSIFGVDTFTIGGKNPYKGGVTPSCLFYGQVDEVRIYSGVLTEQEAKTIYEEVTPPASEVPRGTLLAEYNFNDETTRDTAGNHDATFYDNADIVTADYINGVSGKALRLSEKGSGEKFWLSIPYSAFGASGDSFTLSMWFQSTGYNTAGEDSELFTLYNSGKENFLFYAPRGTGYTSPFVMKWDGTYGFCNQLTLYEENKWQHLVFSVSDSGTSSSIAIYINGETVPLDQGGAWANSLMSLMGIDTFTIGGKNPYKGGATPNCLFYGAVDEVRIYSGVLTEQEAAQIYSEHVHSWQTTETEATCEDMGMKIHYCPVCNNTAIGYVPYLSGPFTKAVFAGDLVSAWTDELCSEIERYQNSKPAAAVCENDPDRILEQSGDLIVIADGREAFLRGTPVGDYQKMLADTVKTLQEPGVKKAYILLCGLPYFTDAALGDRTLEEYAAFNAAIRTVARTYHVLYADLYQAESSARWTVGADGATPTTIGNTLISGEILRELIYHCVCLGVNGRPVNEADPVPKADENALEAFRTAEDVTALETACMDPGLRLSLDLYIQLTNEQRTWVLRQLLAADRTTLTDFTQADALFSKVCMEASRSAPKDPTAKSFHTYVAVGDSITEAVGAVDKSKDSWAAILGELISSVQGTEVTVINNGIGGTCLCTPRNDLAYPAGKEVVDSYIVQYHPDLVTSNYGSNDHDAGTPLSTFIDAYRIYLNEIREKCPETEIVVCGLCMRLGDTVGDDVRAWNAAIKALAEELGILYVDDYHDVLGSVKWLFDDLLHPSNAGYRVYANAVFRTLCGRYNLGAEHDYQITNEVRPSCTEPGSITWTCSDCGDSYTEVIPATGHNYVDGVCTVCGENKPIEPPAPENPFEDVHESDWFFNAVLWAISQDPPVTNGKTATTFAPTDTCTRAEVVQFLWNAAGKPAVGVAENPFDDVKDSDWFYNAVMWAVANGITNGKTATTFAPTDTCTRAEVVQFLRNAAGKPDPTKTDNPFEDVRDGDWFYASVLWAVEKGITAGTSATTFEPTKTCTRAEVVQFLMKAASVTAAPDPEPDPNPDPDELPPVPAH